MDKLQIGASVVVIFKKETRKKTTLVFILSTVAAPTFTLCLNTLSSQLSRGLARNSPTMPLFQPCRCWGCSWGRWLHSCDVTTLHKYCQPVGRHSFWIRVVGVGIFWHLTIRLVFHSEVWLWGQRFDSKPIIHASFVYISMHDLQ